MAGAQLSHWGLLVLRIAVAAVFLLSGGLKLVDPARFLIDVRAFELLPYWAAFATALALPWLEILAALGLWWHRLSAGSALLLALATLAFIGALGLASARGIALDCGCFGDWLVFPSTAAHVAFNCALLAGCIVLLRFADQAPRRSTCC